MAEQLGARMDALEADEQLMGAVLESLEEGLLALDAEGRVVRINERARALLRVNDAVPFALGVLPQHDALRLVLADGLRGHTSEPVEIELHARTISIASRPLSTGGAVVTLLELTALKRLETMRRDFVANVSHELKTPVAAIGLLAEATMDSADDPESVRHFAGRLRSESSRLGALVTELITLSRLQGADPLPEPTVVEVDAVVDESICRLAATAEDAGITVVADRPSGLLVRGDRALLIMALTNLINNAINYSAAGTQVSVSRTAGEGMVRVSVTDRGVGIAPEHTERVFERFFRVDPARSRSTGGTGLGLAIVKQVAANHGGTATVWSRPGTGSTFTLSLPEYARRESDHADPADPPSAAVRSVPLSAPRGAA
jgi:two-component system sensor histidine kinase SenX3